MQNNVLRNSYFSRTLLEGWDKKSARVLKINTQILSICELNVSFEMQV